MKNKKFAIEFPESYLSTKTDIKHGEYREHGTSQAGLYGYHLIYFDTIEELINTIKDKFDFTYSEQYEEFIYFERMTTAAGYTADESDMAAWNAGKICLFRERLQLPLDDIMQRADISELREAYAKRKIYA